MRLDNETPSNPLGEIVGSRLKSVEFLHDYIQFDFDGSSVTTLTLPSIRSTSHGFTSTDCGYRDALRSKIGAQVEAVVLTGEELVIAFVDSDAVVVSLRDVDYGGPEAINFIAKDGHQIVF